jgi:hypothetical protein
MTSLGATGLSRGNEGLRRVTGVVIGVRINSDPGSILIFVLLRLLVFSLVLILGGCAVRPMRPGYQGPALRTPEVEKYYNASFVTPVSTEKLLETHPRYTVKEVTIQTEFGESIVELYQKRRKVSDELVLIFPILGGKYWFERYYARFLVRAGIDAAIILRNPEFKKPENVDRIEELLREGVVRDRRTIDVMERNYGKKQFGSFGISRGGINVAITAGVEPRLKSNVIVMGGTDIVGIFRDTNQRGVGRYIKKVLALKGNGYTEEDFLNFLERTIKTDPMSLAKYLDARHTLMFITLFDRTVPVKYQTRLREAIGFPETYYLPTDHYLSLLYTQFVPMLPPSREATLLPFDFIETESIKFYRREFGMKGVRLMDLPFDLFLVPSRAFFYLWDRVS